MNISKSCYFQVQLDGAGFTNYIYIFFLSKGLPLHNLRLCVGTFCFQLLCKHWFLSSIGFDDCLIPKTGFCIDYLHFDKSTCINLCESCKDLFHSHLIDICCALCSHGSRFSSLSPTLPLWAQLVIESPCPSVCLFAPSGAVFSEASHRPSDHMTRSRPLIGQIQFSGHYLSLA